MLVRTHYFFLLVSFVISGCVTSNEKASVEIGAEVEKAPLYENFCGHFAGEYVLNKEDDAPIKEVNISSIEATKKPVEIKVKGNLKYSGKDEEILATETFVEAAYRVYSFSEDDWIEGRGLFKLDPDSNIWIINRTQSVKIGKSDTQGNLQLDIHKDSQTNSQFPIQLKMFAYGEKDNGTLRYFLCVFREEPKKK